MTTWADRRSRRGSATSPRPRVRRHIARKHLKNWMRRQRQPLPLAQWPGRGWIQYDPLGVVLIIGPWNYPVYLSLSPLVAAVAAGNCAVLKPSELAPATSALLARLVPLYLDSEAIRVVEGDGQTTQDLLAQGFDHALFTGGTAIGKKIMAAAAPTLTPVTLELGGKSPVIVGRRRGSRRRRPAHRLGQADELRTDLHRARLRACASSIADELTNKIVASQGFSRPRRRPWDADRQRPTIRPTCLADRSTNGSVRRREAASSARRLTIEPTVILDPYSRDAVMGDEIFGPDTARDHHRIDRRLPSTSSTAGQSHWHCMSSPPSRPAGRSLVDEIPSGGAVVNHVAMHCLVPQLPFGGVGASGMGAYHGRWGFETMSHRRAVLSKSTRPDPALVYPPYTDRAVKIMRKLF